jgi:hypothetical protein
MRRIAAHFLFLKAEVEIAKRSNNAFGLTGDR